jgi:hypothetical protein
VLSAREMELQTSNYLNSPTQLQVAAKLQLTGRSSGAVEESRYEFGFSLFDDLDR